MATFTKLDDDRVIIYEEKVIDIRVLKDRIMEINSLIDAKKAEPNMIPNDSKQVIIDTLKLEKQHLKDQLQEYGASE